MDSETTCQRSSTEKDTKQIFKFAIPVRACDLDYKMLGIPSPVTRTNSANKPPKYAIPIRMCDMDPAIFANNDEPVKKRPVRKQLWSEEKKNSRLTISFKPDRNIRKSSIAKPLTNSIRKGLEENFHINKKDKLTIPTIKVHKPESETRLQYFNKKPANVSNDQFEEVLNRIKQLEIDNKEILNRLTKLENIQANNKDILTTLLAITNQFKNCGCRHNLSTTKPINEEKQEEKCNSTKTENEELNSSCYIVDQTPNIKVTTPVCKITPVKSNIRQSFTENSTPIVNDLIEQALSSLEINDESKTREAKTNEEIAKLENLDLLDSPLIIRRKNNNKLLIDSHKKLINKFEILESKFKYGSPMSDELSLSDTESPAMIRRDINWLISDKNDVTSPLTRSLSDPSIAPQTKKKSVTFQSQTDLESDPVNTYNEMRKNVNFLCTPKNTRIASNLLTPSVQNSQKKIISRRIQSQLLLLE